MKIILLLITVCLCSCALFKKTSKTTDIAMESSNSQLKSSQLVLKRADRETQIYTYWNDSGYYQYQHIKEQVDQAKSDQVTARKKVEARQSTVVKKSKLEFVWTVMVVAVLSIVCVVFCRRFLLLTKR